MAVFQAIYYAVVLISTAYSITQAKKQKDAARKAADARKGFEVPIEGDATHLPIVYGRAKIGGVRVYHNVSGGFEYTANNSNKVFLTGVDLATQGLISPQIYEWVEYYPTYQSFNNYQEPE
jgi:hypothetical protein